MAETTLPARPVQKTRRSTFQWQFTDLFWIGGLLLMVIGVWGLWERLRLGLAPTALSSYVPWGLWVGFYDYLVWLEVGSLLVFTTLVYLVGFRRLAAMKPIVLFTGFVVLIMALFLVFLDLGHPLRFWHVMAYPDFSSMITWMVWLHSLYLLVLLAKLALALELLPVSQATGTAVLKALSYLSLPMGLALIMVSGSVFGVISARPLWNTASLPLMFLVSSLAAGAGLLTLIAVVFWPGKAEDYVPVIQRLATLTGWLLLTGLFAASVIGFTFLYQSAYPARVEAMRLILTGPFWWSFWIVHILLGVLIPIAIFFTRADKPAWVGLAAFLSVVTFVAVTLNVVIPALVTTELQGLATAFIDQKLHYNYVPNLIEWLVMSFVLGLGALIFGLGFRWLPLNKGIH
jgi:protein NrfD